MSRKKLTIIIVIISVVILAGATIGFFVLKKRTQSKKSVNVFPISDVAMYGGYYGNSDSMSGYVVADKEQNIYLSSSDKIEEVMVEEGDVVHVGDVLLKYDTTAQSLKLDIMKADAEVTRTNILAAERQLTKLQNTTPVEPEPEPEPEPVDPLATPMDAQPIPEPEPEPLEPTYTKEELDKAIADKKREISDMKINYQIQLLDIEIEEAKSPNGEIYANFDGVVKTLADQDTAILEHTPFITVSSSGGYTVQSGIGELSLGQYHVGDMVSMYCYDTGMNYYGTISEISTTPSDNQYSWSSKLQSFYDMTIVLDGDDDLRQGMYMEIQMDDSASMMGDSDALYIPMAFLQKENGKYYIMKDENGVLKKEYVYTGEILWGEYLEIKSGLTMDDYLALPTAKNAKEGVKTERKSANELYGY